MINVNTTLRVVLAKCDVLTVNNGDEVQVPRTHFIEVALIYGISFPVDQGISINEHGQAYVRDAGGLQHLLRFFVKFPLNAQTFHGVS